MDCAVPNSGMGLVWDGSQFVRMGGSDTDESDSEQPLGEAEQVVAILNAKASTPPPLPVLAKHTRATAAAVLTCLNAVPRAKRTLAQDHALRTEVRACTVADWVDQQLEYRRTERTIRFALCFALNPGRSNGWIAKKARGNLQSAAVAKGMALHLRCHPFTRAEVLHGCDLLPYYCKHREARNLARALLKERVPCGSDTLDAAVVLIGFHSVVRHFGAHRYRFLVK
tara:strand:- start:88 stop:765 length:678 start_codon:yes stop_codon:yes gene_type:complete